MPPEPSPTLPSEIRLAVPQEYRNWLQRQINIRYLLGCIVYAMLISLFHFALHWPTRFMEVATLIICFIAWSYFNQKPWNYILDDKHLTVIWWEMGGLFWHWFDILWKRDAITGVEETEWRGWPMLRLRHATMNPKRESYWVMVYAPEDAEIVRTQVIPLVEKYRHQHRQSNLAERLRS